MVVNIIQIKGMLMLRFTYDFSSKLALEVGWNDLQNYCYFTMYMLILQKGVLGID